MEERDSQISPLVKSQGETEEEYQIRLYQNKNAYGLTNDDIADILNNRNGTNYDESKFRKETQAWIRYHDAMVKKYGEEFGVKSSPLFHDYTRQKQEAYIAKQKVRDQRREFRKLLREYSRFENLKEVAKETAQTFEQRFPLQVHSVEPTREGNIGVALWSDWHLGMQIDDFLNNYNEEVFSERFSRVIEDTIRYGRLNGVDTLNILNLGDLVDGNIHVSTRVAQEENLVEQLKKVAKYIEDGLVELSKHFSEINFYSVTDNHARANKSYHEHIENENFLLLLHWHLEVRFQDHPTINIMSNKISGYDDVEIGIVHIYDDKAFFVHGHNDRMNNVVSDLSLMLEVKPVAIYMGHYHHNVEKEEHGVDLVVNPSLSGVDRYAKKIRRTSKPRQKLDVYTEEEGRAKRVGQFFLG